MADSEGPRKDSEEELFGKELGLMHKVIVTGRKIGVGKRFWTALADDERFFHDVMEFVNTRLSNIFTIVRRGKTFSELIVLGKYNNVVHLDSLERDGRSLATAKRRTVELISFSYSPTPETVLAAFERKGLKRPDYEDALEFGAQYPDEQRKRTIVFLVSRIIPGTMCCNAVVLHGNDQMRYFDGNCAFNGGLSCKHVFAGVRESR